MTDKTCNGWTNYETWLFNLYFTDQIDLNDFESQDQLQNYLEGIYDEFEDQAKEAIGKIPFFSEMLNVKSDVNFYEIAKNHFSDK